MRQITIFVVLLLALSAIGLAQEGVTDDDVNDVAEEMYCPVCENITLETCGTPACEDWRQEIRVMLSQGMTETQIKADFVDRFGDQVVGTPHNPILRALALITPWVLVVGVMGVALRLFVRWGRSTPGQSSASGINSTTADTKTGKSDYRSMLEQDIEGDQP